MQRRRLTPRQRSTILAAHGGLCARAGCDRPAVDIDHILCLALGGADDPSNMEPLCSTHHAEKTFGHDIPKIAKAKRMGRKHRGEIKPKRTIRSAGFPKHLRKRMNGEVVAR